MTEAVAGVYEGEGKFVFEKPVLFAKGQKVIINFEENELDNIGKRKSFFRLPAKFALTKRR